MERMEGKELIPSSKRFGDLTGKESRPAESASLYLFSRTVGLTPQN